jgi:hypothetical protein
MINLADLTDEFAAAPVADSRPTITSRIKAVLAHAADAIVASRQEQANRIVLSHLALQDDKVLAQLGMDAAEIRRVRTGAWRPAVQD